MKSCVVLLVLLTCTRALRPPKKRRLIPSLTERRVKRKRSSENESENTMLQLPNELRNEIISYLPFRDILSSRRTKRDFLHSSLSSSLDALMSKCGKDVVISVPEQSIDYRFHTRKCVVDVMKEIDYLSFFFKGTAEELEGALTNPRVGYLYIREAIISLAELGAKLVETNSSAHFLRIVMNENDLNDLSALLGQLRRTKIVSLEITNFHESAAQIIEEFSREKWSDVFDIGLYFRLRQNQDPENSIRLLNALFQRDFYSVVFFEKFLFTSHLLYAINNLLQLSVSVKYLELRACLVPSSSWLLTSTLSSTLLEGFYLSETYLGHEGEIGLALALDAPTSRLKKLELDRTDFSEVNLVKLMQSLVRNTSLRKVLISEFKMSENVCRHMLTVLRENRTLRKFSVKVACSKATIAEMRTLASRGNITLTIL